MSRDATPGRLVRRSGVLLSALFALAACDAIGGGSTIRLDSAEVALPGGADVHEVGIEGAGAADSLAPATLEVRRGDAVRFIAGDHRTHAIAFLADSLEPGARAYLEESMQLRGPPLVNRGSEWVVVLDDAPPGRYPFVCVSHGARGVVTVREG